MRWFVRNPTPNQKRVTRVFALIQKPADSMACVKSESPPKPVTNGCSMSSRSCFKIMVKAHMVCAYREDYGTLLKLQTNGMVKIKVIRLKWNITNTSNQRI